ncbi:LysM peptidoglycan-binding domain-containing protein [Sessilibacter sp. MAH2]
MKIRFKKLVFSAITSAILSFSFSVDALAQAQLRQNHPDEYIVVEGDTLWDISATFLENPWMWPEIWHVNPQINNPHLIFPGDVVRLVYLDGQPRLTIDKRTQRLTPRRSVGGDPNTVKLAPAVRVIPLEEAIPAIPLDVINAFLNQNRVLEKPTFEHAPYVLGGQEKRILLGAGDKVYARGEFNPDISAYNLYRLGDEYVDPLTKEVLGYRSKDVGSARLNALQGEVATMQINRMAAEITVGDRLLPNEERAIDPTFFPSAPDDENFQGLILEVQDGLTHAGKFDVLVLNKGVREQLEPGDVLAIYKEGETIRDRIADSIVQLPEERVGIAMVFRTFEKVSYALILEAERPINVNDKLYSPVRNF